MASTSPSQFWKKLDAAARLADVRAARFEADTPEKRLRRMAEAVVLPQRFNAHYLGHYFRGPAAPFHQLLYLALAWERHVAVRVPRGHSKSTVVTFAYVLHQVVCGPTIRAYLEHTLERDQPALYAAIREVMAEQALIIRLRGPLTRASLGLPDHWDPKVDAALDAWLLAIHARELAAGANLPLHWDPYIQIIGADAGLATEFTGAIRKDLEENALLRSDWGDLKPCYTDDWGKKVRRAASDEDFECHYIRVRAFGMDQDLRGGKHGAYRPTLAIGDDPDSERITATLNQRNANNAKIDRSAEPGLEPEIGRIFLCGTPHHPDCLIVRYTEAERYRGRYVPIRFRAADEKGIRLYSARFSAEHLRGIRMQDPVAYESELGDRPPAIGGRPFTELHYYSRADFEGVRLPMVMAFDPSLGRTAKSDFQALVTLRGFTAEGKILVHRARFFRIGDPKLLAETVNDARIEDEPDLAVTEAISAGSLQEMLLTADARTRAYLSGWLRIERQDQAKDLRIRSLAPDVNGGILVFPDDGSCRELELQFSSYGQPGAKVDGPDVTEMARRYIRLTAAGPTVMPSQRRERTRDRIDGTRPDAVMHSERFDRVRGAPSARRAGCM